jgi:hypothetical protein
VALFVGDLERAETAAARLCSLPAASAEQLALGARIAFARGDEQGCAERARSPAGQRLRRRARVRCGAEPALQA